MDAMRTELAAVRERLEEIRDSGNTAGDGPSPGKAARRGGRGDGPQE
jgi:hypothetical protein